MVNQTHTKRSALLLTVAILSQIVGGLLHGAPAHPDEGLSTLQTYGVFFVFIFWWLSVLAWGQVLSHFFRTEQLGVLGHLALGSLGASLTAMTLGHIGMIGSQNQMLFRVLALSGHIANFIYAYKFPACEPAMGIPPRDSAFSFRSLEPVHLVLVVAAAIAITFLLNNSFPLRGSDEYYYHLLGPKLWSDAGRISLHTSHPVIMQCSLWEYLYLWGYALVAEPGAYGLIEGQIFARWTHVAVGFAGTALALYEILKRYSYSRTWIAVALIAALSSGGLLPSLSQAKNDWGVSFWLLTSMLILISPNRRGRNYLVIAGMFLGAALAAKFSVGLTALPLLATWIVFEHTSAKARVRSLFLVLSGACITLAPILLRNWIEVGNPVFPAMNNLFHSPWASLSWQDLQSKYEVSGFDLSPKNWENKLAGLLNSSPWIASLLLFPLATAWRRHLAPLFLIGICSFLLTGLKVNIAFGEVSHVLRLHGPGSLILTAACVLLIESIINKIAPRATSLLAGASLVFILTSASIPWKIWLDAPKIRAASIIVRETHVGGAAKAWLRLNAKPHEAIFSTGDDQIYYIAHLNVIVMTRQPVIDALTAAPSNAREILRTLREYNGRYLLDSRHWHSYAWSDKARRMTRMLLNHPEALVFTSKDSDVYDLVTLEKEVMKSCSAVVPGEKYL